VNHPTLGTTMTILGVISSAGSHYVKSHKVALFFAFTAGLMVGVFFF
jgi:hypothetical protein